MKIPKIGDSIHVYSRTNSSGGYTVEGPRPGIITVVHSDKRINAVSWNAGGTQSSATSLTLLNHGDAAPLGGTWAEWPKY